MNHLLNYPHEQLLMDFEEKPKELVQEDFIQCDIVNIRNHLPTLYDSQIEDVSRIEKRFQEGKGYLVTNGTGTGKTFVGLGTAYRFYIQDKKNIIIVVPTDAKCLDWIADGFKIGLPITKLSGIKDSGTNVVVTTYANFRDNDAVERKNWDLVIYDESHYLNQNAQGQATSALARHRAVASLPSEAKRKAKEIIREKPFKEYYDSYTDYTNARNKWELDLVEETIKIVSKTKVLFLSATPFAYHKSIKYIDGCLYDIDETVIEKECDTGYNVATGFEKFLVENFGYQMKYNKITKPGPEVDTDILERKFFEDSVEKGLMSTRVLQLEFDYSREFITLDSDLGEILDKGMGVFNDIEVSKRYPNLSELSKRKWSYNNLSQLLECIKARESVYRIQEHLCLGRKVVVFHTFNHSKINHPFHFNAHDLLLSKEKYLTNRVKEEIKSFNEEFSEYVNLDLSGILNPREAIKSVFPNAKEFNGTVSKKKRFDYIKQFNDDNSDVNVILVQTKAGREGISLHDKTSWKPRVILNLGLPTAPTQAIQEEGRIYRSGLYSDAIYEYMTLQTDFERYAFATKIAERSKTAENLAMGNLARDLERAFKDGYAASHYDRPHLNQGIGGKENDRSMSTISEYDKAKTYYFSKQKKNARNKAKEGIDYFATPEPLGYKMVEWLKRKEKREWGTDCWIEPSAGHGAIARFFPKDTKNIFIEPSNYLASQLAINCHGDIKIHSFEDYYIGNKANYIVMNPPFGRGGKKAVEHLQKAFHHLDKWGGELLAILPQGNSCENHLQNFVCDKEYSEILTVTGQIILPTITFNRAGTSVATRLIKIVRHTENNKHLFENQWNEINLSYIKDVNEFFNELEHLEF